MMIQFDPRDGPPPRSESPPRSRWRRGPRRDRGHLAVDLAVTADALRAQARGSPQTPPGANLRLGSPSPQTPPGAHLRRHHLEPISADALPKSLGFKRKGDVGAGAALEKKRRLGLLDDREQVALEIERLETEKARIDLQILVSPEPERRFMSPEPQRRLAPQPPKEHPPPHVFMSPEPQRRLVPQPPKEYPPSHVFMSPEPQRHLVPQPPKEHPPPHVFMSPEPQRHLVPQQPKRAPPQHMLRGRIEVASTSDWWTWPQSQGTWPQGSWSQGTWPQSPGGRNRKGGGRNHRPQSSSSTGEDLEVRMDELRKCNWCGKKMYFRKGDA